MKKLRIILVGPDEARRRAVAAELAPQEVTITGEYGAYSDVNQLKSGGGDWDVALLDLDTDRELCLAAVDNIRRKNAAATVMVYSTSSDSELLKRCMWAGAREFLTMPLTERALTEALIRAGVHRQEGIGQRTTGKLLVFIGAKGGTGASTIAANFALALRHEAQAETALLDLDLELGEVSLILGLKPRFTLLDVLRNSSRLDRELVSGMLVRHDSGLAVMAGPETYDTPAVFENGDLSKLLLLLREQFAYVVIDAGPNLGKSSELLFELAESIYVVSQADVPGLRNAQRYVNHMQSFGAGKVRLVLNRYEPRRNEIDEEHIAKAVGVPVDWKIPNDYVGVRRSHNTGTPLAQGDSPISRALHQMARAACGKAIDDGSKKRLGLFR